MFEFILKLVLTDHWYDEIESGRKTKEFRLAIPYWLNRLKKVAMLVDGQYVLYSDAVVQFQRAYRKNPPRMKFLIKKITIEENSGDLNVGDKPTIVIELGERVE